MYYQNYEDYMRSILGYPIQEQRDFISNTYINQTNGDFDYLVQTPRYSKEILDLYPEIYKLLTPMICKICEANTKPITSELIEQMTDEIYLNIESDMSETGNDIVNVRVNLPNTRSDLNDNNINKQKNVITNTIKDIRQEKNKTVEEEKNITQNRETRQRRINRTLRDLIKILILNQLLGGRIRPPRPYPPRPPRPLFPGAPGNNPRQPRPIQNNLLY